MKALTYNKYRAINIIMLSVVFIFLEAAIALGANRWFPELAYTLSLTIIFASLEMMRWKLFGAISCIVSGLTFCIASGANGNQFLIYCIGNLAMLLALVYLKLIGYEKVRKNVVLSIIYVILVFILAQFGRWGMAMILGSNPLILLQFISTDALSGVFGIIVILIMRNVDGMFENQNHYLLRMEEERRRKQEQANSEF